MAETEDERLLCDVLILVTTSSEREQLEVAARNAGLTFQRRKHPRHGRYYSLGVVGDNRVNAVKTEMGPFGYEGSASKAIQFKAVTGATGVIQLGMAFGVNPAFQKPGDVLVSTSLIPYDNRKVVPADVPPPEVFPIGGDVTGVADDRESGSVLATAESAGPPEGGGGVETPAVSQATAKPNSPVVSRPYRVDYSRADRHPCKQSLLNALRAEHEQGDYDHQIFFGGMLSGGALIFSSVFLRELVEGVPQAEDSIVGGEMEGVGLLSASPRDDPSWIVVKGVSDFADESRHRRVDVGAREAACRNAARFVLNALVRSKIT